MNNNNSFMNKITILHGDNIELLKQYPDNYFDSVVTDAPYGLGKEPNPAKLIQDWNDHGYHEIKGSGFMGKTWDAFVPQPVFWKEVFRVLKPGGYLLCFFGTRTYDWGTLAIRLAGFEIRDMICWHYGSGFPKSMNISKAFDKDNGVDREIVGVNKSAIRVNSEANHRNGQVANLGLKSDGSGIITAPTSDEAKEWEGYGTALKPATEPICVARKPLIGTVIQNIREFGTGAINIDKCRIATDDILTNHSRSAESALSKGKYGDSTAQETHQTLGQQLGRFPANVILDPFSADLMDKQSGTLTSGKPLRTRKGNNHNIYGQYAGGSEVTGFGDTGGASRFFYVAKPTRGERDAGLEHLVDQSGGFKNSSECGISPSDPYKDIQVKNFHVTVKPIAIMRYLIRLVTPSGGLCLDPYAGSGTTGCAAALEGIDIVLMEREQDYIPLIEGRTKHWQKVAEEEKQEAEKQAKIQQILNNQTQLF